MELTKRRGVRPVVRAVITAITLIATMVFAMSATTDVAEAQGDFTCSVTDNVLSWTDQGQSSYIVRQSIGGEETFLARVDGATTFDLPGAADTYTVRYRVGTQNVDTTCAGNPAPPFTCTLTGDILSWTDQRAVRYDVRRIVTGSSSFLATVNDALSLDVSDAPANFYVVRAHPAVGDLISTSCAGAPLPPFTCTVADGLLSWTDQNAVGYNIRQSVGGDETFLGSTPDLSFAVSGTADSYTVRYRDGASLVEATCDGTPPPPFACTHAGGTLTWTDQGDVRYDVRRIVSGASTFLASIQGGLSLDVSATPANFYVIKAIVDGVQKSTACPGDPLPPFDCSVAGGLLTWSDQNASNYNVRQTIDGTEAFLGSTGELSFPVSGLADSYAVRYRDGANTVETTCDGNPPVAFDCSVTDGILSWSDQQVVRYDVRSITDGSSAFLASVEGALSLDVSTVYANFYVVKALVDGVPKSTACVGNPLPTFACSIDGAVLSWTDQLQDRYQVRQVNNGLETFLATVNNATELALSAPLADEYVVRYRLDGVSIDTRCTP